MARKSKAARRAEGRRIAAEIAREGEPQLGSGDWRGTIKPDKASMEEALRVTCSECGYSAGRHSGFCSRSR